MLLLWPNFRFNCWFCLVSSSNFICRLLISSAFFSLLLRLFNSRSFLPPTTLVFFFTCCFTILLCSFSRYLAVLSSLSCLYNFLWLHITFCFFFSPYLLFCQIILHSFLMFSSVFSFFLLKMTFYFFFNLTEKKKIFYKILRNFL